MNDDQEQKRFRRLINSEGETNAEIPAQTPRPDEAIRSHPLLDEHNMPLPRRVNQVDLEGTRVTPAAFEPTTRRRSANRQAVQKRNGNRFTRYGTIGCLIQILIAFLFVLVIIGLFLISLGVYEYYSIASSLPPVGNLQLQTSQFETTRILDSKGDLLYEILDPNAGRRTYVPLGKISPALVAATIATEDKDYYSHPGYDLWAIIRAIWQNYTQGETVTGASTITQQIARAILLSPQERTQRTYLRKAREIILAAEITRRGRGILCSSSSGRGGIASPERGGWFGVSACVSPSESINLRIRF